MDTERRFEAEQERAAAEEAASIGGRAAEENLDPAERPVFEGGGGEAEGFEEAERALTEHASHGDEQPAHAILHDVSPPEEPVIRREDAEADEEHSSERDDDR
jgi:hypothetical protein